MPKQDVTVVSKNLTLYPKPYYNLEPYHRCTKSRNSSIKKLTIQNNFNYRDQPCETYFPQNAINVSIVVTTQRKHGDVILFAVSLHYVDSNWRHDSHLLSVKYYSSVSQFERSFLDLLVKHNIQNKVPSIPGSCSFEISDKV